MRLSLAELVLINMDEYLGPTGAFIPASDPLSFRAHMERALWARLDPSLAPPRAHRHFPDPRDPQATNRLIDRCGGVDVAFGGVDTGRSRRRCRPRWCAGIAMWRSR